MSLPNQSASITNVESNTALPITNEERLGFRGELDTGIALGHDPLTASYADWLIAEDMPTADKLTFHRSLQAAQFEREEADLAARIAVRKPLRRKPMAEDVVEFEGRIGEGLDAIATALGMASLTAEADSELPRSLVEPAGVTVSSPDIDYCQVPESLTRVTAADLLARRGIDATRILEPVAEHAADSSDFDQPTQKFLPVAPAAPDTFNDPTQQFEAVKGV
jgi:hypothetical protein